MRTKAIRGYLKIFVRSYWNNSEVSSDGTHHVYRNSNEQLYQQRFKWVLPFHSPGLAPVEDDSGSFHINDHGKAIYSQRYKRTFGFYEDKASVQNEQYWYHISPTGDTCYKNIWQWCGNYQSERCTVRDFNHLYFHIDQNGKIVSGPHSYAGDFREVNIQNFPNVLCICFCVLKAAAVIQDSTDGLFYAIDKSGRRLHDGKGYFDLDIYHKNYARARDQDGWYFIDRSGADAGNGCRYSQIENFYNGQALVQLFDGRRCVINEQHQIVEQLKESQTENISQLEKLSQAYWSPFALKIGLELKLPEQIEKKDVNETEMLEHVSRVWKDLGLIKQMKNGLSLTEKGRLLLPNNITRDRVLYWLQDRYLIKWLPTSSLTSKYYSSTCPDVFAEIANDPELMNLSQRVLSSYAEQDWKGIETILPLHSNQKIVDLGGGLGTLLKQIIHSNFKLSADQHFICFDRPEVIAKAIEQNQSQPSNIEFVSGDLFFSHLPIGDLNILSRILHDWPDDKVQQLLTRIHEQSLDSSRCTLCVIEREVDNIRSHSLLSLHMYLLQRAHERTRSEWNKLFESSGWYVQQRIPFSGHTVMLLEKEKATSTISMTEVPIEKNNLKKNQSKLQVRKYVIPIAGLATRMMPQSFVQPKVLLPIVQKNDTWHVRPALQLLLAEILSSDTGIEQVALITSPGQLHILYSYLKSIDYLSTNQIRVIIQLEPLGFGHAILQAEEFIDGEPFLVVLGDHLFRSNDNNNDRSCVKQMINCFHYSSVIDPLSSCLTSVGICSETEISETGLLQGHTRNTDDRLFKITDMAEKPSIDIARQKFVPSRSLKLGENEYLCQFGIDILSSSIFTILRSLTGSRQELGLRDAMQHIQHKGQLFGYRVNGTRYDLGNPQRYWETLKAFADPSLPEKFNGTLPASMSEPQTDVDFVWHLLNRIRLPSSHKHPVQSIFLSGCPVFVSSAPARLDVMGGIADYSGSLVLQYPLAQRTFAFVQSNFEQPLIKIISVHLNDLKKNSCLDVQLSGSDLALLCQRVENHVVTSGCDFMDQMTSVYAQQNQFLSLLCQLPNPPHTNVSLPSGLRLFALDSGVKRSTSSDAYRRVRTAAFMGHKILSKSDEVDQPFNYLCNIPLSQFNAHFRSRLPLQISAEDFSEQYGEHSDPITKLYMDEIYPLLNATKHPIEEHFRVTTFQNILKSSNMSSPLLFKENMEILGELMLQSHFSYSACDLGSDETDLLVELAKQKQGLLFGAKITGGGGGGTVAILASDSDAASRAVQEVVDTYKKKTNRLCTIFSGSSDGLTRYKPIKC
ncbi:unnamed protein product [Didymodactylos carnosus]|uniref:UTP--glucose-1-phosphate uridylyltransferase n=1 Tax=Didymodactylos carnosus TaxID=1234261 RepID=A0A8S2H0M6_9BILA|nr:unnamed protein product [Didymodactylos carnosus]CAF3584729.1 unnamed protein product [Didymodactylos carnosus]